MVAEIWASVISSFVDQLVALKKTKQKHLAVEKSGDTGDHLITDQRYNGARCTEA